MIAYRLQQKHNSNDDDDASTEMVLKFFSTQLSFGIENIGKTH